MTGCAGQVAGVDAATGSAGTGGPPTASGRGGDSSRGGTGVGAAGTGLSGRAGTGAPGGSAGGTMGSARAGSGGSTGGSAGANAGTGGTMAGTGHAGTVGTVPPTCGSGPGALNPNPFGCKFAWGASVSGSLASYSYLQFATYWIENGMKADGTFGTCSGCNWVKSNFASSNLIPVYYAYIIGFLGHAAGLEDGNTCPAGQPNCPNLTNQGTALIRNNRSKIVQAYGSYAQQTHAVWPTKPLVWLLEGDFVQYAGSSESNPLTMTELAQLAADITCAIKANMPNAVVALNHSTWNSDQVTNDYWNAMARGGVPYDMVWTTGVANNNAYIAAGTSSSTYNATTATYTYLHQLTGRTIWVDDSCGVSAMADTFSTSSAATLNMRIASGVIAFSHCSSPPSNFQSAIGAVGPQLMTTCSQ